MKGFKSIRSFFKTSKQEIDLEKQHVAFKERFKLGNVLGKGNFSVVKDAVDLETGEQVAVKCIDKKALSKSDKEAIKAEVAILESIEHPNIIQLFGMFEDKDHFFIVTELVKGGELFDRIVVKEYYGESDAAKVVKTIAEALKHLHDLRIVHRDLKPENILMVESEDDSQLKLADFGFAKEETVQDGLKTACGTPGYVAPEILSGKAYGKEVDMWSLGVITYILLCGYPPFYDENQAALFKMIKKAKFKFDPEFWDGISEAAKDFVSSLLVVDPSKRLNCDQVLAHPWIVGGGDHKDIRTALAKLKGYQARRRLKKGMRAVIAIKRMEKLVANSADREMSAIQEVAEEDDKEEIFKTEEDET